MEITALSGSDFDGIQHNVVYDKGREPWASMVWLSKFRNRVAHAKPEPIKTAQVMTEAEYQTSNIGHPQSKLEDDLTIRNAEKAVTRIKQVIDTLADTLPPEQKWGLVVDMSHGSAILIKDTILREAKPSPRNRPQREEFDP